MGKTEARAAHKTPTALKTQVSRDLFHGYMEKAISGKVYASEPPENFQEFVEDYREAFGFEFDPEKISPNASLRSLNKLTANSLWGKVWMSRLVELAQR